MPPVPVGPLVRAPERSVDAPPPLEAESPPEAEASSVFARAAVIGDIKVVRNISLKTAKPMPVAASLVAGDGGEESVATDGRRTVIYAMNWTSALSLDGGRTFSLLNPVTVFPNAAGGFCCDQIVTYIPSVDRFVWVVQYAQGQAGAPDASKPNLLRVATATPAQLAGYDGKRWPGVWYDFTPSKFGAVKAPASGGTFLDRPYIAYTRSMLHLTISAFNLGGTPANGTLVWRFRLSDLGGTVKSRSAVFGGSFVRPAQSALPQPRSTQYFGQRATTSRLNIYEWPDASTSITRYEADVPSTGNSDLLSRDPQNNNWLARVADQVTTVHSGAVTRDGTVWFAWLAGREAVSDVNGKQQREHVHDQPTIEFAGFTVNGSATRVDYETIEFEKYATALPDLRANSAGDLGLSFMFGGPTFAPAHAVGFARSSYAMATTIRNTLGAGGYGDYVGLAQHPGQPRCFVAAGSSGMLPGDADPHYVVFGRAGAGCSVPRIISPTSPIQFPLPVPVPGLPPAPPAPAPAPPAPAPPPPPPPAPKADLVVDRLFLTSDTGWLWNIVVHNVGAADAPASQTALSQGGPDVLVATPALAAGTSTTITTECPYGSLATGTARADAANVVDESSEDNNGVSSDPGIGTGGRCRYP
jgi:hypothetical protein